MHEEARSPRFQNYHELFCLSRTYCTTSSELIVDNGRHTLKHLFRNALSATTLCQGIDHVQKVTARSYAAIVSQRKAKRSPWW
jgi:hypothetical protein